MELRCPKCEAPMRQYERNGITIDQCSECRGIFLDRGELERLTEAESSYYGGGATAAAGPAPSAPPSAYPPTPPQQQYRRGWGSPGSPDSPDYRGHPGQHRRRRKSFLSELFD